MLPVQQDSEHAMTPPRDEVPQSTVASQGIITSRPQEQERDVNDASTQQFHDGYNTGDPYHSHTINYDNTVTTAANTNNSPHTALQYIRLK
jgi:hypothetical protein